MYTYQMRLRTVPIVVACLALLAARVTGTHAHLDTRGYSGTPTGTHVHSAERAGAAHAHDHESPRATHEHQHEPDPAHDADHDGDRDVSLDALAVTKVAPLIVAGFLGLSIAWVAGAGPRPQIRPTPSPRTRAHWRPPLRGPPPAHRLHLAR